jgi:thiosulfate dehydrogenase [quinone] large subunit
VAIALHGFVRLPDLSGFAASMQKQFAETFLPGSLVFATGYCIAIGEAVIGTLLVLGLWLRPALVAVSLLMILLLTGTCLLQNWSVAGLQLGYLAFYVAVLATATCDRFSIDGVLRSRAG